MGLLFLPAIVFAFLDSFGWQICNWLKCLAPRSIRGKRDVLPECARPSAGELPCEEIRRGGGLTVDLRPQMRGREPPLFLKMLEIHFVPVRPARFSYLDGLSLYILIGSPHPVQSRGPRNRVTAVFPYGAILVERTESGRISAAKSPRVFAGANFIARGASVIILHDS